MDKAQKLKHICEVCGKEELLAPEEAFLAGWDYPPRMGAFGIVSPRTCPDCSMMDAIYCGHWHTEKQDGKLRILFHDVMMLA